MASITLDVPCKINLSLDIVGKLPNGYHQMDMIMQSVSLYDTLSLSLEEGEGNISMTCQLENSKAVLACDESNIAVKCARAFLEHTGKTLDGRNLHIHLVKRIPMQAGLGGGSADGAAVLCGLNRLMKTNLSCEQLEHIGVGVGADIPFCIRGGTLRAQGIGEEFSPVPHMPELPLIIVKPNFGISTGKAFGRCDSQTYQHADVPAMMLALQEQNIKKIAGALSNVFEELCSPEEQKKLLQVHKLLAEEGACGSLLSGSGSAVFGIFDDEMKARRCLESLSIHPMTEGVFLCHPVPFGAYSAPIKNMIP